MATNHQEVTADDWAETIDALEEKQFSSVGTLGEIFLLESSNPTANSRILPLEKDLPSDRVD